MGADDDHYYLLKDLHTVIGLANKQERELERYIYDACWGRCAESGFTARGLVVLSGPASGCRTGAVVDG